MNLNIVLLKCELGQRGSDAFIKINDAIEQFDWYLYPEDVKRMLPIVMMMTQQPVAFNYFGSFMCCRDTFKKVSLTLPIDPPNRP